MDRSMPDDVGGNLDVDVAVIGCGPVGAVLAALLGQRGHRVVVVERHPAPYPLPRAVHFDHEAGRILQSCGVGGDLPAISEPGGDYVWTNAAGDTLLRFGGRPVGPSGWPDSNMFWQPALERLVEAAAMAQPSVEVRRGARLVGLRDIAAGVELTVEHERDGSRSDLQARFVAGCDGANSTVRDLIGVGVTDLGFFYDWLIVDVVLDEPWAFDPVNAQICDPARPTTAVSGGPGRRRWEFMRLPGEAVADLDDEKTAWGLLAPWGVSATNATLERHAVYRFQARWAERWRQGDVLLAGDAAHQMPPFAGQGLCSGLRDAANLAWKLDLVLRDQSPAALLDAYEVEREGNVRAVVAFSTELGQVICITDSDEAAARDALMAGMAEADGTQIPPPLPGITAGIVAADDPLAGQLFVQGRIRTDDGRVARFDDVMGAGWRLVAVDAALVAALDDRLVDWFRAIGGEVVTVTGDQDVDGTYADWFGASAVSAVLQRPDFHLFGAARTTDDAGTLLGGLADALRRPDARLLRSDPHGGLQ
jgi:2-polyprenyl-6-methoxyphenol hydroxylase-like FAD-dependent oxidoreductase